MRKLLLASLLILTASCAISPSAPPMFTSPLASDAMGDGGFISLKPCGPPCFYGIVPGTSTDVDVHKAQEDLRNVFVQCKAFDNTSNGAGRGMICAQGVSIAYQQHTVEGVGFSPLAAVTVQQAIDAYGPPDAVNVFVVSLPDNPIRIGASLSYDRLRTVLGLPEKEGRQYQISSDSRVTQVAYYADAKYQQLRDTTTSPATFWRGFGIYEAAP